MVFYSWNPDPLFGIFVGFYRLFHINKTGHYRKWSLFTPAALNLFLMLDDSVKNPISALCGILHHYGVRKVRLIPQDLHALILNILRNRLNLDFLRDHIFCNSNYQFRIGALLNIEPLSLGPRGILLP